MKHQRRNAVIAALLISALLITLTPVSALAAKSYSLWVGGAEVTGMKVKGDGWSYNASTNTLTLKNYTYTGPGRKQKNNGVMAYAGICYDGSETLKIVLNGENSVTIEDAKEEKSEIDVLLCRGNLEISGEGSLTLTAGAAGGYNHGIWCGKKITFKSGTVHVIGGQSTFWTDGIFADAVEIQDGTVHAVGGKIGGADTSSEHEVSKVYSEGVVIGERVTFASSGIFTNGSITVNGGTVIAESGDAVVPGAIGYSQGMGGAAVYINKGTVTVTGGKANHETVGLFSFEKGIFISGGEITSAGGEIAGTPVEETEDDFGSYGVDGKIEINSGTVKLSGNTGAVNGLVKTSLRGTGYTDAAGTEGKTAISAGDQEQKLEFLNIQFPVKMSFGK